VVSIWIRKELVDLAVVETSQREIDIEFPEFLKLRIEQFDNLQLSKSRN
jgi:hypothetical protein